MPELSRFFGIVVRMYHNDYPPPHFHAEYGEFNAKIDIETREVLKGGLPRGALARVREWVALREAGLLLAWDRTINDLPPAKIEPLS